LPCLEVLGARVAPAAGPRVIGLTPTEVRNATFDHVDVQFDRAMDPSTFTTDDVSITGAAGAVTPTGVTPLAADTFRVSFAALAQRGTYQLSIGPDVRDTSGNQMDQNGNGVAGEAADHYSASLVYIQANVIFTSDVTISETNTTYDGQDILIDNATITIDGPHPFDSVHLVNGAVLTHTVNTATQTYKLDLTVADEVIVDATSQIDVSGKGYLPGRTTGNTTVGGAGGSFAGSHGGVGYGTAVFDDYADPHDWGAGGAERAGGGLVRLSAGTLDLGGSIEAGGGSQAAGGGIFVSAQVLTGTGTIGAYGGGTSASAAGGGGGRVAVYYRTNNGFNLSKVLAPGSESGTGYPGGGAGTVYLRDLDEGKGTLVIDARGTGGGLTPLGLPGQTTVSIPDDVVVRGRYSFAGPEHPGLTIDIAGSLTLSNNALLTTPTSSETAVYKLDLTVAGTVSIDSTSQIDVSGKGYLPGRTTGNTTVGGAVGVAGGSHGGRGGMGIAVFDDYADPEDWGAGGGSGGGGGAGGGLVRLTAGNLILNGAIYAQGNNGSQGTSMDPTTELGPAVGYTCRQGR
jgi:hypothetical protein